jgi:hypothetical protein
MFLQANDCAPNEAPESTGECVSYRHCVPTGRKTGRTERGRPHLRVNLSFSPPISTSKSPGSATGLLLLPMKERSS